MADDVAAASLDNLKAFVREDKKWRRLQLESVMQRKRLYIPKVDPQNPFRPEMQLLDQYELREMNRNPRLYRQSQDRSSSLRRIYRPKGHATTSPRGYVDHLPNSASADFHATLTRAAPPEVMGKKAKKRSKREFLAAVNAPLAAELEEDSAAGAGSPGADLAQGSKASKASRRSKTSTKTTKRRSRLRHSSTAPGGLQSKSKPKTIQDMTPSAPSFGHRPQSASRHFDALGMRASRLDRAPVGVLQVPVDDAEKQLDAKFGQGLMKATDLALMLSGGADGALQNVSGRGLAKLAAKTGAQLLWKTSYAAANPPQPKSDGTPKPKRKKKKRSKTNFMGAQVSASTVASDAASHAAAKAARARAHRGAVPPPRVGVGSGFGVTAPVMTPKFQVTAGHATEGGFLSSQYDWTQSVKAAEKAGDEARKARMWRMTRKRDVELLRNLDQLRGESISMIDTAGTPFPMTVNEQASGFPQPSPEQLEAGSGASIFSGGASTLPPGTAASMIGEGEQPSAIGLQYDAESDTWSTPNDRAASVASSRSGAPRARRRKRGKGGKKARKMRAMALKKQQHAMTEAQWDNSPMLHKPARFERMDHLKEHARETKQYRSTTESLDWFARRGAGIMEEHLMFCEDRYATDQDIREDDLRQLANAPTGTAGQRVYLDATAKAITPRDQADGERFTVDNALREEHFQKERRRSISRNNERRRSIGAATMPQSPALPTF